MRNIAGVVIKKDRKYLLIKEGEGPAKGFWNFPAGKVDTGETIEEAAVREAKEESGFEVRIIKSLGVFREKNSKEDTQLNAFSAEISAGALIPGEGIADGRWFTLEEITAMKNELRGEWILDAIKILETA